MKRYAVVFLGVALIISFAGAVSFNASADAAAEKSKAADKDSVTVEWNQWGGSPDRNNTPVGVNIPTDWKVGKFDFKTQAWKPETAKNIRWVAQLGSKSYGNPVVAGNHVYVGTNNTAGWLKRYPGNKVDLGCLLCFDIRDGKFLWQHSSEKLTTGRVHDWEMEGLCVSPVVEGNRLWFITSRGEVRCLDTEGFRDGENNGPDKDEAVVADDEADVIWVYDMMKELGTSQHNMCSCSVTTAGDLLFVCTGNGVDVEHNYIPAPDAPSFLAMDKNTGKVLWTDRSPGLNILHGQWSSPCYGVLGGAPQVIFGGGDGWLYSFDPQGDGKGNAKLLWKFDTNPKASFYTLGPRASRNHIIGTPVIYDGLVYVGVGEDPEHGEGVGHMWCIDPTKRGDVSPELAFNSADPSKPIPHKRLQAVVEKEGDFARPNPDSAAVWHFFKDENSDDDGNGKIDADEEARHTMHRTLGSAAVKDNILYIADFSGVLHCLDAKTGKQLWAYDMLAAAWGSPLIVEGKVYIGDEDGDIAIFKHSGDPNVAMTKDGDEQKPAIGEINMGSSVYSTLIVAGNVLYISDREHLFAIGTDAGK